VFLLYLIFHIVPFDLEIFLAAKGGFLVIGAKNIIVIL
jgi:hypothetical protein